MTRLRAELRRGKAQRRTEEEAEASPNNLQSVIGNSRAPNLSLFKSSSTCCCRSAKRQLCQPTDKAPHA
jgi:hypothetical protein